MATVMLKCKHCGFEMAFDKHQDAITRYNGVKLFCPLCQTPLAKLAVSIKVSIIETEEEKDEIESLAALFG